MINKKFPSFVSSNVVLIFFVYLSICLGYVQPLFKDPDVAWHASAGKAIRDLGYIPFYDPWSFSSDQVWYNISWLWDLITSYLYEVFSLSQIAVISDIMHGLLVAYAYRVLLAKEKIREDAKNIAITLMAMVIWEFSSFRPNIASLFFTVFLYSYLRSNANHNPKAILFIFPAVIAIWVNMHGGFLVGFIVLGAFGLSALYNKQYSVFSLYLAAGILGLVATLVNPYGYHIYTAVLRTLDSEISTYIKEWQPFVFGTNYSTTFFLVIVLLTCQVVVKKSLLSERILFYLWLLMALSSVRSFVYLLILGLPHLAKSLDINLPRSAYEKRLSAPVRAALIATCLVASILIRPIMYERNSYLFEKAPTSEIDFIVSNYPGKNVLNTYDSGGFLIYYGQGKVKHFIDGRAGTAFSEEVLNLNLDIFLQTPRWRKVFSLYNIDVVLLNKAALKNISFNEFFHGWKPVFVGNEHVVLARR